jgi:hypothetical protein
MDHEAKHFFEENVLFGGNIYLIRDLRSLTDYILNNFVQNNENLWCRNIIQKNFLKLSPSLKLQKFDLAS